jgi:membrane protein insertase Oxa1/YidC/SpoIIIJ
MNGNILTNALEMTAKFAYLKIYALTSNFGISLLLLSLVSSMLMILLMRAAKKYPERESKVQGIISPMISKIKNESRGEERHHRISELYRKYAYHPILGLRSAIPVLIQLPFLFAAYIMLSNLSELKGVGFLFVRNLGAPDALLQGNNILPFIMTVVNMTTAIITVSFSSRDKMQACVIALLFLVLLYSAPSALLVFWTMNNITLLIRTVAKQIMRREMRFLFLNLFSREHTSATEPSGFFSTEKLVTVLIPYFALLSLFYLYQAAATFSSFIFSRGTKPFYFFVSSTGLLILLVIKSRFKFLSFGVKIIITCLIVLLIVFCRLWESDIFGTSGEFISVFSLSCITGFILTAAAFFISLFGRDKTVHKEFIPAWKRYLLGFAVAMAPALYIASNNSDYLHGMYYAYYILVIAIFSTCTYLWLVTFSGNLFSKSRAAFFASLFSFLFVLLPVIRSRFVIFSGTDLFFFLLFLCVLVFFSVCEKLLTFNRLVLFAVFFSLVSVISIINRNIDYNIFNSRKTIGIPASLKSIEFKTTPNIYLFVYDGIPNFHVFDYLSIRKDRLKELLDTYEFKVYENTYSLGSDSLGSMASTLNCSPNIYTTDAARNTYSGNSLVSLIFKNKGYKIYNLLTDYHTGTYAVFNKNLVHETYPPVEIDRIRLNFFTTLIRGFFQGEFSSNTKGMKLRGNFTEDDIQKRKLEIIMNKEKMKLVINHSKYPHHAQNSGKCRPDEKDIWIGKYNIALDQMEKDFSTIREYDPNAIVIAIGDHGPFLAGDCARLRDWEKEKISADLILDRMGTMVAIRWPNPVRAKKYDRDLVINPDIFLVVFSYLSGNNEYLKMKPDRTVKEFGVTFREGKLIE